MNLMYACVYVLHGMALYGIVSYCIVLYECMHVCMQKQDLGDNPMTLEAFKIFHEMLMALHEFQLIFIDFT